MLIPICLLLCDLEQLTLLKYKYLSQAFPLVLRSEAHQPPHSFIHLNSWFIDFHPAGLPLNPLELFFSINHPGELLISDIVQSVCDAIALPMTLCVARSLSLSI